MSNSEILKQMLAKEDENLKRLVNPGWTTMAEQVRAIQEQSNLAATSRISEIIKSTQIPTALSIASEAALNASKLKQALSPFSASEALSKINQQNYGLLARFSLATSSVDEIMKQRAFIQTRIFDEKFGATAAFEIARQQSALLDSLSSRAALVDAAKLSTPYLPQATLAWDMASNSLTNRMKDIGLLAQKEMLSARLFEVPNAFAEFVSHTANCLAENPIPDIAARLRGSLNLAEYQLLEITDTFSSFIVVPEDDEEPERKRILNVPRAQQNELLDCEFDVDENDKLELINASPIAQTQQMARRILELVVLCNEAGKTSRLRTDIFKPTNRVLTVFYELPWISATDKCRFGDVVDGLYFIFYEGAGKDNLRFLEENGGPLTKDDCDFIWCIKCLRNKWTRHDADHGNPKDIRKSWTELSQKFQWLGLANHPTNADFQHIHYNLLTLAEEFLLCILNRLTLI